MKFTTTLLAAVASLGVAVSSMTYLTSMSARAADEAPKGSAAGATTAKPASDVDLSKMLGEPVDEKVIMAETKLKDVVEGSKDAPITIIEYASMTCPHCAQFHNQVYAKLKKPYIETGKVKFILREFPFGDVAAGAFMLGRCVAEEKRAPLLDEMFATQPVWSANPVPELLKLSKQAGMSEDEFNKCLGNQELLNNIISVKEHGVKNLNVRGTPTIFINGRRLTSEATVANLSQIFDALAKQGS